MNANDKTEKVLREIHIMLSKAEPYKPEPSRVIINKQQMIDLLAELNKCIYAIQDEYELTEQSRNHAEREFRKKGDQIVWDASRKAEDVYAASVIYTDEALSRVRTIDNEEKSIYANRQTEIKVNMDYIRKLGLAEGEDLGDGVVGEVKLADDTPDAGLNHSNDKDEAKAAGSKSSVDEDYKAISRKAGNPPVINTKEGKELTDGIHRMWQSITGNKGK